LAVAAALSGLSALAGAVGLLAGWTSFGPEIDARLPFGSPTLAGIALAAVVGVPMLVLAVAAWKGDPRTDALALVAGGLLIGWIVVQTAVIRAFSPFQPAYLLVGVAFAVVGWRAGGRVGDLRST
jgi:hypothetical protein